LERALFEFYGSLDVGLNLSVRKLQYQWRQYQWRQYQWQQGTAGGPDLFFGQRAKSSPQKS